MKGIVREEPKKPLRDKLKKMSEKELSSSISKKKTSENRIIGHDASNPEIAVKGGAGSYNLSSLKSKAQSEAQALAEDIAAGKFKAAAYNVNQLKNTLETIVEAEEEMSKSYFNEGAEPGFSITQVNGKYLLLNNNKQVIKSFDTEEEAVKHRNKFNSMKRPDTTYSSDYYSRGNYNEDKDPCWKNYKQVGMKKKNGKDVPNCVPKESVQEVADTKTTANQTGGFITPEHDRAYATLKVKAPKLYDFIRNESPVPLDPIMTLQALQHMRSEDQVMSMIRRELAKDTERMYDKNHPSLAENIKRMFQNILRESKRSVAKRKQTKEGSVIKGLKR